MLDPMETNGDPSNEMTARFRINREDGEEIIQVHLMSDSTICFGVSDGRVFILCVVY